MAETMSRLMPGPQQADPGSATQLKSLGEKVDLLEGIDRADTLEGH